MKVVMAVIIATMLSACGTLGGMVEGAGNDLQKAGKWIKE
jgi:predicted small secreted protein